jgi:hypothetical protein
LNELEAERSKQQSEAYVASYKKQLTDDTDRNKKFAESIGISYTPEIHNECVKYAMKHDQERGYPISLIQAFREIYEKQISDAMTQKIEADVLKRKGAKPSIVQGFAKNNQPAPQDMASKRKGIVENVVSALFGNEE